MVQDTSHLHWTSHLIFLPENLKVKYKKILVLSICEAGRHITKHILNTNQNIEYKYYKPIDSKAHLDMETLNFITDHTNKNLMITTSTNPLVLINLSNVFNTNWKVVYIERNILSGFSSYLIRKNVKDFDQFIFRAINAHRNIEMFYEKVKSIAIKINFNDLFNHTQQSIEHIFKFLELPTPDKTIVQKYASTDSIFSFLSSHNIIPGEEANYFLNKQQIQQLTETIEKFKNKPIDEHLNAIIKPKDVLKKDPIII